MPTHEDIRGGGRVGAAQSSNEIEALYRYTGLVRIRGYELTKYYFQNLYSTMAPKERMAQEGKRIERKLQQLDNEQRRLRSVEDFHRTKAREVKERIGKVEEIQTMARATAAEKEKACLQARKELDVAVNQEERLRNDRERMLLLLREHKDFVISAVEDSRRAMVERDADSEESKQHRGEAALRTARRSVTSDESGWTSEIDGREAEKRKKLEVMEARAKELEKMTKDVNSNILLVRQEMENLDFRDNEVLVCCFIALKWVIKY